MAGGVAYLIDPNSLFGGADNVVKGGVPARASEEQTSPPASDLSSFNSLIKAEAKDTEELSTSITFF